MSSVTIASSSPVATVARLAEGLGSAVVEIVAAPHGLDVPVTEVVIFDPMSPTFLEPGDVVLGVGVQADQCVPDELLAKAGEAQAAAVVLKLPRDQPPPSLLQEAAKEAGTAVLGIPPEMGWGLLHTHLRTVMLGSGSPLPTGPEAVAIGDLFALANSIAAYVGGAVTIEDTKFQVLAYSSLDQPIDKPRREVILSRRYPDSWAKKIYNAGIPGQLYGANAVVTIEGWAGLRRRMAVAIRAGTEILGSIWVVEGEKKLGQSAEEALLRAAQVASLHMVHHGAPEDLERRRRGETLHALLEGRGQPELVASDLGLEAKSAFIVMAFELYEVDDDANLIIKRERVLGVVRLYFEAFRRKTAVAAVGKVIYVLVPCASEVNRDELHRYARDVVEHTQTAIGVGLLAGIGSTVADLPDTPSSRNEADKILRVLRVKGSPCIADIDEVRAQTILLELRDLASERPQLRLGKLHRIIEHDRAHRGTHLESLKAYLDARGDVAVAAGKLGVHPNTLRYRIRRAIEISGICLDDPEERLVAELQLRLLYPN